MDVAFRLRQLDAIFRLLQTSCSWDVIKGKYRVNRFGIGLINVQLYNRLQHTMLYVG